jgi:EAL domain-containing protein (putative c-di-GMP-specific phosphodiesterase class I)/CheY-like chemotaxis protein
VHFSGRERRIGDDDADEALLAQADRRLSDADVGLTPDDDRCPSRSLANGGKDLGRSGEPEGRFAQHGRARREMLDHARIGRAVQLGLLLGHDDRDSEPSRERDEPDHAIQRRVRSDSVLLRKPLSRKETTLDVHHDEYRVTPLEQAHAPIIAFYEAGCAYAREIVSDQARISVLIADDDRLVREVLTAIIRSEPTLRLVGAATDAYEAIAVATAELPDVAIVDVHMPGGGVRAAREILRCSPATGVIAHTSAEDHATVLKMLDAGAIGYLVKGTSPARILESVEMAARGRSSLSGEVTRHVIEDLVQEREARRQSDEQLELRRTRIDRALSEESVLRVVGQPICALDTLACVGFEALARFHAPPKRGPDRWFAEASEVGLRAKLELVAVRRALERLDELPAAAFLSVNVSPETISSAAFRGLVETAPSDRIVIEITEHAPVTDYDELNAGLANVRGLGVRLAIDDAGAGFASLRHILRLQPDFIKLDVSLVAGVENDPSQQALAVGLISFAEKIGATIVAEGIENESALAALRALGVEYGQGYFLGRPSDDFGLERAQTTA